MTRERLKELFDITKGLFPDGVSSPVLSISPYSYYIKSMKGSEITDINENRYINYNTGYSPLLPGDDHPVRDYTGRYTSKR